LNRKELLESWDRTESHLQAARKALPATLPASLAFVLRSFDEFVAANELELALGDLAFIGSQLKLGDSFWNELKKAANNMGVQIPDE
jgi:hypothetical protein